MDLDGALRQAKEFGDVPVGLALGQQFEHAPLGGGELDAFAGRMVRAGADTLEALRAAAAGGLSEAARTLRLQPWGPDDPLA